MATLLDPVRQRRAELEAAATVAVDDEQRVRAIMAVQARAEQGDEAAKATMAAVERLFAEVGCQKS
jgi:hypothetical protein